MSSNQSPASIIVSTALKTLAVLILISALVLLACSFAIPGATGDFFHSIGMEGLSLRLAKSAYERSDDINDLSTVIDRAVSTEDHQSVIDFAPQMLAHRQYYAFCAHVDGVLNPVLTGDAYFSYDHYLRGNYALSLAKAGRCTEALGVLRTYMRFDESTLSYHGIASYYLIARNTTIPQGLDTFLARANVLRAQIEGALGEETDPARIDKLERARLELYSEINGVLALLGQSTADWSL